MKAFHFAPVILGSLALALTACTQRTAPNNSNADLASRNTDLGSRNADTTVHKSVTQAPGEVSKIEKEKGHADVEIKRQVVESKTRVETEKKSIPTVAETKHKADINRMSQDDFQALGLSNNIARNVVKYRDDHGRFKSLDEITRVPGVSMSWFNQYRNQLGLSTG